MAQLAQQSLLTPDVPSSNQVTDNFLPIHCFLYIGSKDEEIEEKVAGNGTFWKKNYLNISKM